MPAPHNKREVMIMPLNQKESTLLGDLRSQEQLCVDKYTQYANDACDSQLKNLFTQIRAREQQHLQTLDQIASGIVPQMQQGSQQSSQQGGNQQTMQFQPGSQQGGSQQGGGQQSGSQQSGSQQGMQFQSGSQQGGGQQSGGQQSGGQQGGSQQSGGQQGNQQNMQFQPSNCSPEGKKKDAYLCQDALSTEKHVSSTYNTCIFEFRDPNVRNVLNHIQKEEQQHGEQIYCYMAANGMYA